MIMMIKKRLIRFYLHYPDESFYEWPYFVYSFRINHIKNNYLAYTFLLNNKQLILDYLSVDSNSVLHVEFIPNRFAVFRVEPFGTEERYVEEYR